MKPEVKIPKELFKRMVSAIEILRNVTKMLRLDLGSKASERLLKDIKSSQIIIYPTFKLQK